MSERIAITGSTGFVGSLLAAELAAAGHGVVALTRRAGPGPAGLAGAAAAREPEGGGTPAAVPGASAGERGREPDAKVAWDPATGALGPGLGTVDAFVHLAGENIAGGRWTAARKRAIADSRGPVTERLCRTLAALPVRPRVLVSASATGIFGDRGDEPLDDDSAPGTGFLADVATEWERATRPAADAGIRVVNLRIAPVLDRDGGVLQRMLLPFRLGLGGVLGTGAQWLPWISRRDLVRAIRFAIATPSLHGPVLACSPHPVTNRTFTKALGRALHRPTVMRVPRFVLRTLLGEMADALLLASQRASASRLPRAGFVFEHPHVEDALRAALRAQ